MSDFEQLIIDANNQNDYDKLYDLLLDNVMNKSHQLYNKLEPFLQHVNDENLNALYNQLLNHNSEILNRALVHNVVNTSKYNNKLKRVLEAVLIRSVAL